MMCCPDLLAVPLRDLPPPLAVCFLSFRESEALRRAAFNRQEAMRVATEQEAAKREAAAKEENARREVAKKEEAARMEEAARKKAAAKEEYAKWDAAKREAATKLAYERKREAAREEDAKRAAAREEAATREAAAGKGDAMRKAAKEEAVKRQEDAKRETTAKEEAARMEAKQKVWMKLVKKVATKRETAAKEATARMEAAVKENARMEATKKAATQREAAVLSWPESGSRYSPSPENPAGRKDSEERLMPKDDKTRSSSQLRKEKCVKKIPAHDSVLKNDDDERSLRHPNSLLKSLLLLAVLFLAVFLLAYICSFSSVTFQAHDVRSVLEIRISVPHLSRFSFGKLMISKLSSTSFHMLTRSSRLPRCSIHMTGCECGDPPCPPT